MLTKTVAIVLGENDDIEWTLRKASEKMLKATRGKTKHTHARMTICGLAHQMAFCSFWFGVRSWACPEFQYPLDPTSQMATYSISSVCEIAALAHSARKS